MSLSDALVRQAVTEVLDRPGPGPFAPTVQSLRIGKLKAGGKHNDIAVSIHRSMPEGAASIACLRELLRVGEFVWDISMAPFGIWQRRVTGKGVVVNVEVWLYGPLCRKCNSPTLDAGTSGLVFRRKALVCQECSTKHHGNPGDGADRIAKTVRKMVQASVKA